MRGTTIDLHTAAEELGVHYQTAYQWVRSGRLPAHRVGRRYEIRREAIAALAAERSAPTPPPPARPRAGFAEAGPKFHEALTAGDERRAGRTVRRYLDSGTSLTTVIEGLIAPSLRVIGDDWVAGRTSIAVEHRASAIAHRLIAEHMPSRRGRPRGVALVGTPAGDHHDLIATMATAALREHGWRVQHLGANLPADEFLGFVREHPVDLVVLSAGTRAGRESAAATAELLTTAGTPCLVGQPGQTLTDLVEAAAESRRR